MLILSLSQTDTNKMERAWHVSFNRKRKKLEKWSLTEEFLAISSKRRDRTDQWADGAFKIFAIFGHTGWRTPKKREGQGVDMKTEKDGDSHAEIKARTLDRDRGSHERYTQIDRYRETERKRE